MTNKERLVAAKYSHNIKGLLEDLRESGKLQVDGFPYNIIEQSDIPKEVNGRLDKLSRDDKAKIGFLMLLYQENMDYVMNYWYRWHYGCMDAAFEKLSELGFTFEDACSLKACSTEPIGKKKASAFYDRNAFRKYFVQQSVTPTFTSTGASVPLTLTDEEADSFCDNLSKEFTNTHVLTDIDVISNATTVIETMLRQNELEMKYLQEQHDSLIETLSVLRQE